jgi:hypothetical protein
MRKSKYFFACLAAATLVACGGGGDDTTLAAADAPPITVNPTTGAAAAQALSGKPVSFANGVTTFGTPGTATTLTVTAGTQPTFTIAAGGQTATGNLTFGSCIFTVTNSDFVAPHPLAPNAVVTVADCKIDLDTTNKVADGGSVSVQAIVSLDGVTSAPITTTVTIQSNGDILVGGSKITSVSVTQVTGGA